MMTTSQGWAWCVHLLRALIGRSRTGGLRGVGLAVAVVVGAASLTLASVSPASTTPGDPVLAWGDNSSGELGNGTNTNSNVPVSTSLPSGTTVTAIAAGGGHGLALTSTGQVLAWGANFAGALGNGTTTDSNVPVSVLLPAGTTVTAIAGGLAHSLALTSTGQVLAWGDNGTGQLGNGTNTSSNVPVSTSLPSGTTVTAIAAGAAHSLALTSTGQVLAWGSNISGQLGNGTNTNSNVPVSTSLPAGTTVTAIAAGGSAISGGHSLALTSTGQVLAWGFNSFGQLGNGTNTDSNVPVSTSLPSGTTISGVRNPIAAGGAFSLAIATTAPPPTTTTFTTTKTKTVTKTTTTTKCCHEENNENNNNDDDDENNDENNNEDHEHEDNNHNEPWRLPMAR